MLVLKWYCLTCIHNIMYIFHVKPQLAGANVPRGIARVGRYSASIYSLFVHMVRGQEKLTRFVARLAFIEKVYYDLVELEQYVNTTLTNAAGKAASALALPTKLVRQEDGVGIQASHHLIQGRRRRR